MFIVFPGKQGIYLENGIPFLFNKLDKFSLQVSWTVSNNVLSPWLIWARWAAGLLLAKPGLGGLGLKLFQDNAELWTRIHCTKYPADASSGLHIEVWEIRNQKSCFAQCNDHGDWTNQFPWLKLLHTSYMYISLLNQAEMVGSSIQFINTNFENLDSMFVGILLFDFTCDLA